MTKEQIVEKIKEILRTDFDLDFLLKLKKKELETLISCIRDRIDHMVQKYLITFLRRRIKKPNQPRTDEILEKRYLMGITFSGNRKRMLPSVQAG